MMVISTAQSYIGTATIEVEGETWRIAVVTADAEEVKKPEKN